MAHHQLRRCADDGDDDVDVFAQTAYSDDDDDDDTAGRVATPVVMPAVANDGHQDAQTHDEALQKDNEKIQEVKQLGKRVTAPYENKRVDRDTTLYETVSENAPYFQHERRLPEPDGEKQLRRRFVFHADEEEEKTKQDTPAATTKGTADKYDKDRWDHDWFERLEAGGDPPNSFLRRGGRGGRRVQRGGRGGRGRRGRGAHR